MSILKVISLWELEGYHFGDPHDITLTLSDIALEVSGITLVLSDLTFEF